jgi:hypothetical protein
MNIFKVCDPRDIAYVLGIVPSPASEMIMSTGSGVGLPGSNFGFIIC